MRYIHFFGDNGYCGTDYHHFEAFPDSASDNFLNGVSDDMAHDNAESYSYLATGWDGSFESEEEEEQYYQDALANCVWEELSKEQWDELKEMYGY